MLNRLSLAPLSLRARLALALALAAALPLLLAVALISGQEERTVRREALAHQQGQAVALARAVQEYVGLHRAALAAVSDQPRLLDMPLAEQRQELQVFARAYPDLLSIALYSRDGDTIVRSDDVTSTLPVRGYPVYELARQTDKPSLDILQSPIFHRPVFAFGAPIHDQSGNFAALITAALPSTKVAEFLSQQNVGAAGHVFLVDDRGRAIAHTHPALVESFTDLSANPGVAAFLAGGQPSGALSYTSSEGEQLVGYAPVTGLGWGVFVERPSVDALSGLRGVQAQALAVLGICLAITALAGLVLAGMVTAPVNSLLVAVRRLATDRDVQGGGVSAEAAPDDLSPSRGTLGLRTTPELAQLVAAFVEMRDRLAARTAEREAEMQVRVQAEASLRAALATLSQQEDALRHANEELEAQVAARTEDLRFTNAQLRAELAERRRAEASLVQTADALAASEVSVKQALVAAEESEARYRSLVEWAPIGIMVHDGQHILYANPACQAMFHGSESDDLIGRRLIELLHPEYQEVVLERVRRVKEEGATVPPFEQQMRRLDGSYVDVVTAGVPTMYRGVPAIQVVALDITDRKRAEAEREAILSSMIEGVVIATSDGEVVQMNPAALRMHGFARLEDAQRALADYRNIFDVTHVDGSPMPFTDWPIMRAMHGETFVQAEARVRVRDTGRVWYGSYGGTRVRSASRPSEWVVITVRDVTAQKQVEWERERLLERVQETAAELAARERALRAARDELEQRVRERTQELRLTAEDLAQANERLGVLYDIDQAILAAQSPAEVAQCALYRLIDAVPCDRASIMIFAPESEDVRIIASAGLDLPELPVDYTFSRAGWALPPELFEGKILTGSALRQDGDPLEIQAALGNANLLLRVRAPLFVAGEVIGLLNLLSRAENPLPPTAIDFAAQVSLSLALALHNSRLTEQVRASRAQLQALNRRMVEVQENERRAIARELHDEAGQALTTLMIGLGLIEREAAKPDVVMSRVAELKLTAGEVLGDLHDLAIDLRPASLDRLGLVPALRQYVNSFRRQNGLDVILEDVGVPAGERFAPEVETTVYRVVQEALTNVTRHARASYVGILIERRPGLLVAIVEDNGAGFDAAAAMAGGRLGLLGMSERAEMVGGSLTIESTPGSGTTVFIEVPV